MENASYDMYREAGSNARGKELRVSARHERKGTLTK